MLGGEVTEVACEEETNQTMRRGWDGLRMVGMRPDLSATQFFPSRELHSTTQCCGTAPLITIQWLGKINISHVVSYTVICTPVNFHVGLICSFLAPDTEIQEPLRQYYELGLSDVKVTELLKEHYDTEQYGLRCAEPWIYKDF